MQSPGTEAGRLRTKPTAGAACSITARDALVKGPATIKNGHRIAGSVVAFATWKATPAGVRSPSTNCASQRQTAAARDNLASLVAAAGTRAKPVTDPIKTIQIVFTSTDRFRFEAV